MKTVLIPTTFHEDTLYAVNNALNQVTRPCRVVLLHPVPMPDSFAAAEFIRKSYNHLTPSQTSVLEKCHAAVNTTKRCRLEIRTQIDVTAPLLRNLIDFLNVNLVVVSASYRAEKSRLHTRCLEILLKLKCPVLQLRAEINEAGLKKALYLESKQANFNIQELQQQVGSQFNFKIVSHADITEAQSKDELADYLTEAVEKNNIDLLIETRTMQNRRKNYSNIDEILPLPVLSINEEAIKA